MEIKVPFYNIVNMLLTGLVFVCGLVIIFPQMFLEIIKNELFEKIETGPEIVLLICFLGVMYEIGLIVNRFGSVIIEPVLKKIKIIPFNDNYILFNTKKKDYPIMNTLSREYAVSRTSIALFFILTIVSAINKEWIMGASFAAIATVFCLSCRKHSSKIVELMEKG